MNLEQQLEALTNLGYSLADAQRSISFINMHMPRNVRLESWVPSVTLLDSVTDSEMLHDAKSSWYSVAPDKYKRILEARLPDAI